MSTEYQRFQEEEMKRQQSSSTQQQSSSSSTPNTPTSAQSPTTSTSNPAPTSVSPESTPMATPIQSTPPTKEQSEQQTSTQQEQQADNLKAQNEQLQQDQLKKQDQELQQLPSLRNRGKSLSKNVREMIDSSTSNTTNAPKPYGNFTPGMQAVDSQEEYFKYEGRSPNHSFYIDYKNPDNRNATSSNKVYPEPGEGSSGTGPFPPEYVDTIGLKKQREQQASNTKEPA